MSWRFGIWDRATVLKRHRKPLRRRTNPFVRMVVRMVRTHLRSGVRTSTRIKSRWSLRRLRRLPAAWSPHRLRTPRTSPRIAVCAVGYSRLANQSCLPSHRYRLNPFPSRSLYCVTGVNPSATGLLTTCHAAVRPQLLNQRDCIACDSRCLLWASSAS